MNEMVARARSGDSRGDLNEVYRSLHSRLFTQARVVDLWNEVVTRHPDPTERHETITLKLPGLGR